MWNLVIFAGKGNMTKRLINCLNALDQKVAFSPAGYISLASKSHVATLESRTTEKYSIWLFSLFQ